MLFYNFQVGFGYFDPGGQKILDADNDVCFVGFRGDFTFNATKVAFDDPDFIADGKRFIVKADTIGIQVHDKHKVCHLFVGNNKHRAGKEIPHIEKPDTIHIGNITGGLLRGADKNKIADNGDFTPFPAIF